MNTPTSADAANALTLVMAFGLVLLTTLVSSVAELTIAMLVIEPLAGAFTVKVTLLTCPAVMVPSAQLTPPPELTPPPVALTKVTPVGNVSVTNTVPAEDGPKLVMETV